MVLPTNAKLKLDSIAPPLVDALAMNSTVLFRGADPILIFTPSGSNATLRKLNASHFALGPTDTLGDLVIRDDDGIRRWRTIDFPTRGEGRNPLLFRDDFMNLAGVAHASSDYSWWSEANGTDVSCKYAKAATRGLVVTPISAPGSLCLLEGPRAAALSSRAVGNWISQQLAFDLKSVRLAGATTALTLRLRAIDDDERKADLPDASVPLAAVASSASLSLVLNQSSATIISVPRGSTSSIGRTILSVSLRDVTCCPSSSGSGSGGGCDVRMLMDVRNVSLTIRCSGLNEDTVDSCASHGVSLKDWGSRRAAGATIVGIGAACTASVDDGCDANAEVSLRSFAVRTTLLPGSDRLRPGVHMPTMPAVTGDGVGGFSPRHLVGIADLGTSQPRAVDGFVDATSAPFSADPTGREDATLALQRAIDWARWHYYGVLLPIGEYRVTSPLVARQISRQLASGHVPGMLAHVPPGGLHFTPGFLLDGVTSRYVPTYIRGELDPARPGRRATLRVPPRTLAFINASQPGYVLSGVFDNPNGVREPNEMYNSVLQSVDVVIGEGNAGAVGVRWRGAQGTGLEDVTVRFEGRGVNDGLVGIVGGAGSGGAHHGVRVEGGRYGLDFRQGQPSATLTRATLVNQSCGAILYEGYEALTAVGLVVSGLKGCVAVSSGFPVPLPPAGDACSLPSMSNGDQQMSDGIVAGPVSLIDTRFEFDTSTAAIGGDCGDGAPRVAVSTNRSLYVRRMYLRGANAVARFAAGSGHAKLLRPPAAAARWSVVDELAHGAPSSPKVLPHNRSYQSTAPAYINGARIATGETAIANMSVLARGAVVPSAALLQKPHGWGTDEDFPSFESAGTLNMGRPPKGTALIAATGDGVSDDAPAIQAALDLAAAADGPYRSVFLPRGTYACGATLRIPPGAALVGAARHLTRIVAADGFSADTAWLRPAATAATASAARGRIEPAYLVEAVSGRSVRPTVLAYLGIAVWNDLKNVSALRWAADWGIVRQFHAQRSSRCGSLPDAGCATSVPIDAPLQLITGARRLRWFTFYLEDCCANHTVLPGGIDAGPLAYWSGFLAGPQLSGYRHLLVRDAGVEDNGGSTVEEGVEFSPDGGAPLSFLHLNCEHGTGDAICEFDTVRGVDVHGFKTEGNQVGLYVHNSHRVRFAGSGGVGCLESSTRATFQIEDSTDVTFASLADQAPFVLPPGEKGLPHDAFGERACVPTRYHTLRHDSFLTPALERPILYKVTSGGSGEQHGATAPPALTLSNLLLEYLPSPVGGVDVPKPRFTWELGSTGGMERGLAQMACVLQVALYATFDEASLVMNATIHTNQTSHVPYVPLSPAHALRSSTRYFWRVASWGTSLHFVEPRRSGWSSTTQFHTGLFKRSDWKGEFIGGSVLPSPVGYLYSSASLLRRDFDLPTDDPPAFAFAFVAAAGLADLSINAMPAGGSGAGARVLEPPLSQFEQRLLYTSFDVTNLLRPGRNTLGVALGRGFWSHYEYGEPCVLLQLNVRLVSGALVEVHTEQVSELVRQREQQWRMAQDGGPVREDDLFNGEVFDGWLRAQLAGWDSPTFPIAMRDRYFAAAVRTPARTPLAAAELSSALMPPTVTSAPVDAVTTHAIGGDAFVLDFGTNGAGWSRLVLSGNVPPNATITLTHTELLLPDKSDVYTQYVCTVPKRVCVRQSDTYRTAGGPDGEAYEPRFTWHGFRYVRVDGCPVVGTGASAGGVVGRGSAWRCVVYAIRVGTALPRDAHVRFGSLTTRRLRNMAKDGTRTDDAGLLNTVFEVVDRTMRSNNIGFQTSCPQREKVAWTGDTLATAPTTLALYGGAGAALLVNYVRTLGDNQAQSYVLPAWNGSIADTVPHVQFQRTVGDWPASNGSWPGDNGGFTPVFPLTVLRMWRALGDVALVQRAWPKLVDFATMLEQTCGKVPSPIAATAAAQNNVTKCGFYGDWARPGVSPNVPPVYAHASTLPAGQVLNSFYTIAQVDAMAELGRVVGAWDKAAAYAAAAVIKRREFDDFFWNATLQTYAVPEHADANFVQFYSAISIALGCDGGKPIGNAVRQRAVVTSLLDAIDRQGGQHNVGLMGWTHLLASLTCAGEHATAQRLIASTKYPSVGWMISDYGAGTTLYERWPGVLHAGAPPMTNTSTSLNHPMFGSAGAWMLRSFAGLDTSHVGSTRVVHARPGVDSGLVGSAAAKQHTLGGLASISWEISQEIVAVTSVGASVGTSVGTSVGVARRVLGVNITVPTGCTGSLVLPTQAASTDVTVLESGRPVWHGGRFVDGGALGVVSGAMVANGIRLHTEAGAYAFVAKG